MPTNMALDLALFGRCAIRLRNNGQLHVESQLFRLATDRNGSRPVRYFRHPNNNQ